MKAIITVAIIIACLTGCKKEEEPELTKKGARWGIIYRDTTNVDSISNQTIEEGEHVRK